MRLAAVNQGRKRTIFISSLWIEHLTAPPIAKPVTSLPFALDRMYEQHCYRYHVSLASVERRSWKYSL